jgi:FG-GAP-like repeat
VDAADLNRDGILDLVVENQNNGRSVLLGKGDGTFKGHVDYLSGFPFSKEFVGDFNGDGIVDLATGHNLAGVAVVDIFLGNGDGTFADPITFSLGGELSELSAGDFNNDGRLDLTVTHGDMNKVSILLQARWLPFRPAA